VCSQGCASPGFCAPPQFRILVDRILAMRALEKKKRRHLDPLMGGGVPEASGDRVIQAENKAKPPIGRIPR